MKVLVIGGAGYIGSHVVYELVRQKHTVYVLDNLSTGNKEAVHSEANFIEGDQLDMKKLNSVFKLEKFDVVMHFSAKLVVPESVKKPIEYFKNNVYGVTLLLEAMNQHNVKNIVFSSTAAVYGNLKEEIAYEWTPKNPIQPYGQSKLSCEWLIEASAKAYNLNFVIFRYFNVAGADESGDIGLSTKGQKITHLIPVVIETALGLREKVQIYGDTYNTRDGTCIRDYIHIIDLAKIHIKGAKYALSNKSGIFNLGTEKGFTVKEVIETATKTLKQNISRSITAKREGDPGSLVASNSLARKKLNFTPKFSLEQMIASDYAWRKNKKY